MTIKEKLLKILSEKNAPISIEEIVMEFDFDGITSKRSSILRVLNSLLREGEIQKSSSNQYSIKMTAGKFENVEGARTAPNTIQPITMRSDNEKQIYNSEFKNVAHKSLLKALQNFIGTNSLNNTFPYFVENTKQYLSEINKNIENISEETIYYGGEELKSNLKKYKSLNVDDNISITIEHILVLHQLFLYAMKIETQPTSKNDNYIRSNVMLNPRKFEPHSDTSFIELSEPQISRYGFGNDDYRNNEDRSLSKIQTTYTLSMADWFRIIVRVPLYLSLIHI